MAVATTFCVTVDVIVLVWEITFVTKKEFVTVTVVIGVVYTVLVAAESVVTPAVTPSHIQADE